MCGRFTIKAEPKTLAAHFGLVHMPELEPRFNVAPTQAVPVVRAAETGRRLDLMRWGLVPSWATDPAIGNRQINARGETVAEKPSYRSAFRSRRCLLAADGFYEWAKLGSRKQPYYFRMKTGEPFAFAGLWEYWHRGDDAFESCALITGEPNEVVRPVHDRMPVILHPEAYELWLDPGVKDVELLKSLLVQYPAEAMEALAVSTLVNSPGNDRPDCIRPLMPG